MTTTDPSLDISGNDVRGFLLMHDQIRAVVPEAARHVRALRPGDRRAARALVRWWAVFSRALHHHHVAEDTELWPLVLATAPELAAEVRRLEAEHAPLDADLAAVTTALERIGTLAEPGFRPAAEELAAALSRLDTYLRRHLASEEELVLPVMRHRIGAADWTALEKALADQGHGRDTSVLLPMFLAYSQPDRVAFLRDRLPAPVLVLHDLVLGPRYRRLLKKLPAATR
ncbi:hemerythrin domain-containing protein [Pseudonocardia abyssalis]|uniref:Hemerythrin domain-containing protein n=1 Tax=Pseudonocardia abyssalis TaxID=2792008 RepID=A0ABS6UZ64_9PSEU|nr:hemerythrin domain-containing protein [Pseudonocardia abyssalis]MBW0117855.1 hemerythrin domain-containing protein [Pseudonocardia abyssalis]MBW0137558.1 hemerythrin domain-containing protein [Pseudonocardia abyssalis]